MSTQLEFEPNPDWNINGKITFTYEGADPSDKGPAGTLLRMFLAQLSQDEAGLKAVVTESTFTMGKPSAPGKDLGVKIKETQYEGDDKNHATVPADLMVDGQPQELPFLLVKEVSGWKVDMPATMQKLMGASMEQLTSAFEEGMKQMADGMKGVMEGMGEAMSQAFGGAESAGAIEAESTNPAVIEFRQELDSRLSLKWNIRADDNAFETSSPELLKDALNILFAGLMKISRTPGGIDQLEAVQSLYLQKASCPKSLDRQSHTLIYTIGETDDGRSDIYDNGNIAQALTTALDGITQ